MDAKIMKKIATEYLDINNQASSVEKTKTNDTFTIYKALDSPPLTDPRAPQTPKSDFPDDLI